MGQFDLEIAAALTQLEFEELSKTPGGEFAEIIGDLVMLVGTGGLWAVAGGASNLALKVRKLAGASYASNLIFAITAVRNDLKTLYDGHENLRARIESLGSDPNFAEAISALALRAMHTSVKDRLKRLACIVVNGVKEDDLELEGLDDMMRAAVELKDTDIILLGYHYKHQSHILIEKGMNQTKWYSDIQSAHRRLVDSRALDTQEHLKYRSSYLRLESLGLMQEITSINNFDGVGNELYALLIEGKKFYERLQDIAAG
jgi:hypothetical protein